MTALALDRKTDKFGTDDTKDPLLISFPVAAATKIFGGAIVCTNSSGYAVPGSTSTTLKAWGRCERLADNSAGAAGDLMVTIRQGVFYYASGTAGDAITFANVGAVVYIIDDQTVGLTDGGGTRSKAGVVFNVDSRGQVAVGLGFPSLY